VSFLKACPSSFPGGPTRLLYLADAYYLQDEVELSFKSCRDACLLDKWAAGIFFWVGKGLAIEGRVDEAARFMDAGRSANPAARDWQAETFLALALKRAGREAEAMTVLERLAAAYTSYSAEFLIGGMLLERGDRLQAGRHFDKALGRLESQPGLEVDLPEVREAVLSAVRFYECVGSTDKAGRVKNDTRFGAWF
jgi:tetratricopeptide (TPR) repeat protein